MADLPQRLEPPAPPAIRLDAISKHFGDLEVLRAISFEVAEGEIVALAGASGCGKSTLLNIVSGLLDADAGTVRFDGRGPGNGARTARGEARPPLPPIAYMFQEDRLLPWRTAIGNVEFGLEAQPMPAGERSARAREALRLVGLAEFEKAYPHELSGGMRSRAALARSLVVGPRILLMDEPFSKLDPQTRAQMHLELLRIHGLKPMSMVFVTHDVEEAVVLADRVILLAPRPGTIREIETVSFPRPRSPTEPRVAEAIRLLRMKM